MKWEVPSENIIFQQICKGLCALHEMGIIHRDIKTLNILLDNPKSSKNSRIAKNGISSNDNNNRITNKNFSNNDHDDDDVDDEIVPIVKIGDLGVGRELSLETVMVNTFYGTPLYASPERCENKPYNENFI